MFGQQQNTGLFGQGGNTNFLSSFNPTGGTTLPANAPSTNASMWKPRKWVNDYLQRQYEFKNKLIKIYNKT